MKITTCPTRSDLASWLALGLVLGGCASSRSQGGDAGAGAQSVVDGGQAASVCTTERGKPCGEDGTCACKDLVCRSDKFPAVERTCEPPCFATTHDIDLAHEEGAVGCPCNASDSRCVPDSSGQGVLLACDRDSRFHLADRAACTPTCSCTDMSALPLECMCPGLLGCATYEEAVETGRLCHGTNLIDRGCGFTQVTVGSGYGRKRYLYNDSDHELIGVSFNDDYPSGICDSAVYATKQSTIPADCTEITTCTLCDEKAWPACDP